MIITCPACDTRFLVSTQAVGVEGREVRCAKCGQQWHAMPQQAEAEELVLEPGEEFESETVTEEFREEVESPDVPDFDEDMFAALAERRPVAVSPWLHPGWKAGFAVLGLAVLLLALIALREPLQGGLAPVYALLGYTQEDGVMLADVSIDPLPSRNKKRYELQCSIINKAKSDRVIPRLRMQIFNEGGDVVAEDANFLPESGRILQPGKSIPCKRLRFENPSRHADRLVIDLGSTLELKLRSEWEDPVMEADEKENGNG